MSISKSCRSSFNKCGFDYYSYNITSQSPVVVPVAAWVKCSKLSSFNSFTKRSWLRSNLLIMSSSEKGPEISANHNLLRTAIFNKKTTIQLNIIHEQFTMIKQWYTVSEDYNRRFQVRTVQFR